nr:MAG TPA: hypothetical protein [Bacteriophage sp.]
MTKDEARQINPILKHTQQNAILYHIKASTRTVGAFSMFKTRR